MRTFRTTTGFGCHRYRRVRSGGPLYNESFRITDERLRFTYSQSVRRIEVYLYSLQSLVGSFWTTLHHRMYSVVTNAKRQTFSQSNKSCPQIIFYLQVPCRGPLNDSIVVSKIGCTQTICNFPVEASKRVSYPSHFMTQYIYSLELYLTCSRVLDAMWVLLARLWVGRTAIILAVCRPDFTGSYQ